MLTTDHLNTGPAGMDVVERDLGRGGMATVFSPATSSTKGLVALEVLDAELGAERFLRGTRGTANR